MLISVLGAGYVGLVTAACLARLGNHVRCVDTHRGRIAQLQRGGLPIHEPGLAEAVQEGIAARRLTFHSENAALRGTALTIVAVGTLDKAGEWTADTVWDAVLATARDAAAPRRIVIRSTLLPGTATQIQAAVQAVDGWVEIGHNPEFTREGSAVTDFLNPERIVIGIQDPARREGVAADLLRLYEALRAPTVITDLTSAEMIKVGSNVFLAAKIAFANELARLAAAVGADVSGVVDGIGFDRRIGRQFLSPGPGFGGSCFPSQARALPELAARLGVSTPLMSAIWPSNEEQATWLIARMEAALGRPVAGVRAALLGVTFKAGTDDLRESPALRLARLLVESGAGVALYDPSGTERAQQALGDARLEAQSCPDATSAAAGADVIVVATEWPEFHELDWEAVAKVAQGRLVVDARRVVDVGRAAAAGFDVLVLGMPAGFRVSGPPRR